MSTDSDAPARHPRKCTAHSTRSKQLCERWAMKGQTVCMIHGGKAPQNLAKAQAGLDLISWTLSERRIRCPRWRHHRSPGGPAGSLTRTSKRVQSGSCWTTAKASSEGHESSILPSPRFAIRSITGERIARKAEPALTTEARDELRRLRKENRELRTEREILKKAAAFFAKHQA